ncbi:uncharacterized protein KQ657_002884 [Scheffersomyces spartinae]|uniref:Ubiquitin carboxyl-terminal hydrolase n=1 Tax=Scheffersomyces spartinae TaxID=45513 RepID=A0A9P7V5I3_9ASCO|nr:uncharacterized protein KQ657_002884 [Scheffersomyces spartinae]KAG7191748.1 hypothetical protein KQ657_002884 [Scheffersomyces spartinae]
MTIEIPSSIPTAVPIGSAIFKDDCMFSFDTAENNVNGLDVCLHCYQGFSRRPERSFTHEHAVKTGHRYFLNITKTIKSAQAFGGDERQTKIAKLEVKDVKDADIYDIRYGLYDDESKDTVSLDQLSPEFQSLIDTIINSNSSGKEDEISSWEQQIFPCEHTIDLHQEDVSTNIDLGKCGQCELKENLWICLHCGHLGCGRQQFGSDLKGNGHALDHYSGSGHPVAVKLGSLNADDEDKADVYCYKCNDEVKVHQLAQKLMKYGINIRNAIKSEKNLIELNLDQNINWQFQLDDVNGEKLQPIFGPGLTGMKNLGNSCYLNTVVQALFSLDGFKEYFKQRSFPESHHSDPSKSLLTQLLKLYDGLESGRYSKPSSSGDSYQLGIKPNTFSKIIGENHPEFKTQKQQDAYEFLLYLLDKIDQEFGIGVSKDSKFLLYNKTVCTNCNNVNISPELVDNLSIPIEDKVIGIDEQDKSTKIYEPVDLLQSLEAFCRDEPIEGFQCDNCNTTSIATRSTSFRTLPKVLIINTQRIKLVNWVPVKVNVPITFSEPIDIENVIISSEDLKVNVSSEPRKTTFEPNTEALEMLKATGFPENRCIKALHATGNNDAESAMNWLIEHMEDPTIDEPMQLEGPNSNESSAANEQDIDTLMAMGFDKNIAIAALRSNNNDLTRAVDWIYENPGGAPTNEQQATTTINLNQEKQSLTEKLLESPIPDHTKYQVKAIICHKGSSPHTGHYVVFIKKLIGDEWKWVLFNDEKVVLYPGIDSSEVSNNGYIYILEKV